MQRFSATQLDAYLQRKRPRLIDVREPWEFDICHLPDSELVPMAQIPARLPLFHESNEYVIICHHGIRSLQVCQFLAHHGINNTINLDGGVDAWAREIDKDMPLY
jgi:rhodanese-related sulfurtransferase